MATFITTIKFTQQGIKGIDDTTKRAAALKAAGKKLGVKVTGQYWTLGAFDGWLGLFTSWSSSDAAPLHRLRAHGDPDGEEREAFRRYEAVRRARCGCASACPNVTTSARTAHR